MAIDSGHLVLVLLDSSATFDTVDHGKLLTWLFIHFGLAVWLFSGSCYLPDPTHCVKVNGTSSRSFLYIHHL